MNAAETPLFSVRLIAGWLAAAAFACALSFFLITRDASAVRHADESGSNIYSRSALGHAALFTTLQRLGIPVGESHGNGGESGVAVVVIAEPNSDPQTLAHVRRVLRDARAVLLVLPKRRGTADVQKPGQIRTDALLTTDTVSRVTGTFDDAAQVERGNPVVRWNANAPFTGGPTAGDLQLVRSRALEPLVAADGAVAVGALRGRRVYVLSDPDVIANHGLLTGHNAALAVALITALRGTSGGRVVFDEAAHGFTARPFGIIGALFDFPFVLVTVQLAVAVALLLWAGAGRFGAPRPRAPALPAGKSSLIENGARLVEQVGALDHLAARYAEALLRETAQRLHAPRNLDRAELAAWFDRTGHPLTIPAPPPVLDAAAAVATAHAVHHWRNDALDEPR